MAYGARLESVLALAGHEGSNPSLSASRPVGELVPKRAVRIIRSAEIEQHGSLSGQCNYLFGTPSGPGGSSGPDKGCALAAERLGCFLAA